MYGDFREALNWSPMMPIYASLWDSYKSDRCCFPRHMVLCRDLARTVTSSSLSCIIILQANTFILDVYLKPFHESTPYISNLEYIYKLRQGCDSNLFCVMSKFILEYFCKKNIMGNWTKKNFFGKNTPYGQQRFSKKNFVSKCFLGYSKTFFISDIFFAN